MTATGTERTTARNIKALFSRGTFLRWLRKGMGLGDTLGPLPPEAGGTGRTSTGSPVRLTASASGNVMTYTCPDALDNHDVVLLKPFSLSLNTYAGVTQCLTVPISLITEGGNGTALICARSSSSGVSWLAFTLRRTSATTFTITMDSSVKIKNEEYITGNSYAV